MIHAHEDVRTAFERLFKVATKEDFLHIPYDESLALNATVKNTLLTEGKTQKTAELMADNIANRAEMTLKKIFK